jgi:hypothetical protein
VRVFIFSALFLTSLSVLADVPDFFNARNCKYSESPIIVKQPSDRFGVCYGQAVCTFGEGVTLTSNVSCIALADLQCPDLITCSKESGVTIEDGELATLQEDLPSNETPSSGQGSGVQQ